MSLLADCQAVEIVEFPGANLDGDESTAEALISRNVEFLPGLVRTRRGFAVAFTPAGTGVFTMYNWIQAAFNRLVFLHQIPSAKELDVRILNTGSEDAILTGLSDSILGVFISPAGARLHIAFFDTDGTGVIQGRVWDGTFTGPTANVEKAFQRPMKPTELTLPMSEPAAGVVTAGLHKFGVLITTRNGYITRPSPSSGTGLSGFSPTSFTATGAKNLRMTLTPATTWPSWVYKAQVIMSPVINPDRYYIVPEATTILVPGSVSTFPIDFNIDDVTLQGTAADVIERGYFDLLSMDGSDAGPFNPHVVVEYNNRAVWIANIFDALVVSRVSTVYASEPFNYQWITEDQHRLTMPGAKQVVTAFVLGGTIYFCGPSGTFAATDNGLLPVEWPPVQLVDGRIGTLSIFGAHVNASGQFAWVADQSGLYVFSGGAYARLPTSYWQTEDWRRINWAAPQGTISIKDNFAERIVRVMAPLDGATTPTHILSWNYTRGVDADSADYSIDNIVTSGYPRALEVVMNPTTKKSELWVARSSAGAVLRQKSSPGDSLLYNDNSGSAAAIDSAYRRLVRKSDMIEQHVASHLWVKGSGSLGLKAFSADQVRSQSLPSITGSASPGKPYLRFPKMQSERCALEINNGNTVDAFFELARIAHYFTSLWPQRS